MIYGLFRDAYLDDSKLIFILESSSKSQSTSHASVLPSKGHGSIIKDGPYWNTGTNCLELIEIFTV
jgi:hypothetical protein